MEHRQLEIFRILARELSFTRTAARANCVQSNVTVQIRLMERELGVPLFERLGKQVRLTTHGHRLLPYAERILHLLEEAATVAVGGGTPAGTFTIGSPESVLTYRLPPVLHSFRQNCPNVDLNFRASGRSDLIPQLEQGELDIGLVIDDTFEHPNLSVEALCPEPLKLLVGKTHPLASAKRFDPAMASEHTFLLTDAGCAYRTKLERSLARANVAPKTVMEFTSVETIKQCAVLGMGVACLPGIVADAEIESGKLKSIPWKLSELQMQTLVVWHKDKWQSPAMKAFLCELRTKLSANLARLH